MLRSLILLLVLITAGCSVPAPAKPTPVTPAPDRTAEEYAVYAAYIHGQYLDQGVQRIVIRHQTDTGLSSTEHMAEMLENAKAGLPGLDDETFADYKANNQQPSSLEGRVELNVDTVLLTDAEFQEIFNSNNTTDSWEAFYHRFPDSQGVLTFSRVGFNQQMDQALLYAGNQFGWLGGAGYYVLIVKENGVWKESSSVNVWIS